MRTTWQELKDQLYYFEFYAIFKIGENLRNTEFWWKLFKF